MKKVFLLGGVLFSALLLMGFYAENQSTNKYDYKTIHTTIWTLEPRTVIFETGKPTQELKYKKKDGWEFTKELERIQSFEDQGWELMEIVNQNSSGIGDIMIVMRKKRD